MRGCMTTTTMPMEKKANNVFERISDEILEEVLMHIANPKLITQCKLVCRRWYSIVSRLSRCNKTNKSKSFTLLFQWCVKAPESEYGPRHYKHPILALSSDTGAVSNFDTGKIPMMDSLYESVVASCKDLLLVAYKGTFHVINPDIRQWITLPPPPRPVVDDLNRFGVDYNVGFLWDYDSDLKLTYKVMRIGMSCFGVLKNGPVLGKSTAKSSLQIYDSRTNGWSEYDVDWYPSHVGSPHLTCAPILSHAGMFHWLNGTSLLSLDPSNLQLNDDGVPRLNWTIKLPHQMDLFSPRKSVGNPASVSNFIRLFGFGMTGSHIRMITEKIAARSDINRPMSLWQLDATRIGEADDGGMWCLTHTFPFVVIPPQLSMIFVKFLAFHPYEEDVLYVQINKVVLQLCLRTHKRKEFKQTEPYDGFCWVDQVFPPLLHQRFPTQLTPSSLTWEV